MKRFVLGAIAVMAMLFLAGGAFGLAPAFAQTPTPTKPASGPFAGLQGIPKDQRFDHIMSGQFSYTDANGTTHNVMFVPGTVSSLTDKSITITANGQTTTSTYNITSNTVVHAIPDKGSTTALKAGDKVFVVTDSAQGSGQDALVIAKASMMGGYHAGMMGGTR